MRIFLASILSLVAVSCSSSQKNDEVNDPAPVVDAAVAPEPIEVDPGPDLSTPYKAVYQALLAASIENEEDAFFAYLAVVHPDEIVNDEAKEMLRQEQWLRFREQHDWYVRSGSRADYILSKMVPAELTDDVNEVRLFLRDLVHKDNAPAEIVVRRDGKQWRIVANGA